MEFEWQQTYDIIKRKHDEAYKTIELAKKSAESGDVEIAIINYKLSIALIDEALATPVALPDDPDEVDETWNLALQMVQKMKRTRAELLHRVATLTPTTSSESSLNEKVNDTNKISGDSLNSNGIQKRPRTFLELAEALQNLQYDSKAGKNLPNVLELLFLCEGVKLYHINTNGEVTTADESSTLRIIRLDQDVTQHLEATYFMQIIRSSVAEKIEREDGIVDDEEINRIDEAFIDDDNDEVELNRSSLSKQCEDNRSDASIIYPLVLGVSPCFRTDYGAFILPDIESNVEGAAFGIVIPTPADQIVLEILESILHGVVRQTDVEAQLEEPETFDDLRRRRAVQYKSETISQNIVHGACFISNGLVKGSEQVGKLVSFTTPYIISKLNKAPPNAPPISKKVVGGVEIAKSATNIAVGVTGFVAGKVGSATMALGKFLAPHVYAQGSKLLSKTMGYSTDEAADKMGGVLTVAAGAVEGFGTVYNGLEQSAVILGKNLSNNSVKVIEHKYGSSAGSLATGTFDTVGNMINLSQNVNLMTPKGLAKKTVKGTGKAIFSGFRSKAPATNYVPVGSLYPDLTEFSKQLSQSKF